MFCRCPISLSYDKIKRLSPYFLTRSGMGPDVIFVTVLSVTHPVHGLSCILLQMGSLPYVLPPEDTDDDVPHSDKPDE